MTADNEPATAAEAESEKGKRAMMEIVSHMRLAGPCCDGEDCCGDGGCDGGGGGC